MEGSVRSQHYAKARRGADEERAIQEAFDCGRRGVRSLGSSEKTGEGRQKVALHFRVSSALMTDRQLLGSTRVSQHQTSTALLSHHHHRRLLCVVIKYQYRMLKFVCRAKPSRLLSGVVSQSSGVSVRLP